MNKPTIYPDTSVISADWYEGADVSLFSRRLHTREWWELERQHFTVWVSAFVEAELQAGTFARQDGRRETGTQLFVMRLVNSARCPCEANRP